MGDSDGQRALSTPGEGRPSVGKVRWKLDSEMFMASFAQVCLLFPFSSDHISVRKEPVKYGGCGRRVGGSSS